MPAAGKFIDSNLSAADVRASLKQKLLARVVAIRHPHLGSIGYHVFESNKLGWLLAGVPDEMSLAEALQLEEEEPLTLDGLADMIGPVEKGGSQEVFGLSEAPEPSVRTLPIPQSESAAPPQEAAFVNFGFSEVKGRVL